MKKSQERLTAWRENWRAVKLSLQRIGTDLEPKDGVAIANIAVVETKLELALELVRHQAKNRRCSEAAAAGRAVGVRGKGRSLSLTSLIENRMPNRPQTFSV